MGLFEYEDDTTVPRHWFGGTDYMHGVRIRIRDAGREQAVATAAEIQSVLNHYEDGENRFSIRQVGSIIQSGQDEHEPPRYECSIKFLILLK